MHSHFTHALEPANFDLICPMNDRGKLLSAAPGAGAYANGSREYPGKVALIRKPAHPRYLGQR
jgi:hypothetical protein